MSRGMRKSGKRALAALAPAVAATLAAVPAKAADVPSGFPAAGPVVWPSVSVRNAPRPSARRVMVLRALRRDYRPQIVLAIGMRRLGVVRATRARLVLANTGGARALELTARQPGSDGNAFRVSVSDQAGTADDVLTVFAGTSQLL